MSNRNRNLSGAGRSSKSQFPGGLQTSKSHSKRRKSIGELIDQVNTDQERSRSQSRGSWDPRATEPLSVLMEYQTAVNELVDTENCELSPAKARRRTKQLKELQGKLRQLKTCIVSKDSNNLVDRLLTVVEELLEIMPEAREQMDRLQEHHESITDLTDRCPRPRSKEEQSLVRTQLDRIKESVRLLQAGLLTDYDLSEDTDDDVEVRRTGKRVRRTGKKVRRTDNRVRRTPDEVVDLTDNAVEVTDLSEDTDDDVEVRRTDNRVRRTPHEVVDLTDNAVEVTDLSEDIDDDVEVRRTDNRVRRTANEVIDLTDESDEESSDDSYKSGNHSTYVSDDQQDGVESTKHPPILEKCRTAVNELFESRNSEMSPFNTRRRAEELVVVHDFLIFVRTTLVTKRDKILADKLLKVLAQLLQMIQDVYAPSHQSRTALQGPLRSAQEKPPSHQSRRALQKPLGPPREKPPSHQSRRALQKPLGPPQVDPPTSQSRRALQGPLGPPKVLPVPSLNRSSVANQQVETFPAPRRVSVARKYDDRVDSCEGIKQRQDEQDDDNSMSLERELQQCYDYYTQKTLHRVIDNKELPWQGVEPSYDMNVFHDVVLPVDLIERFLEAATNHSVRGLECCGFLYGKTMSSIGKLIVTDVFIPEQDVTSVCCQAIDETECWIYSYNQGLLQIGWIHTHPNHDNFLSPTDITTQHSFQRLVRESIAIVCSDYHNVKKNRIYTLSKYGMAEMDKIQATWYLPPGQRHDCHSIGRSHRIYKLAEHVEFYRDLKVTLKDARTQDPPDTS